MSRDLSLKTIRVHGKRVKCKICKQHDAVENYCGIFVCRKCLRPMIYGVFLARTMMAKEAIEDESKRVG